MREIEEKELEKIQGGAMNPWALFGLGTAVVFLIGLFDGYTRPYGCNN